MTIPRLIISAALFALPPHALSALMDSASLEHCGAEAKPCMRYGAAVFQERCSLCHGSDGMGEGALPLSVKEYPATNLLEPRTTYDDESLRRAITEGPLFAGISPMMPPWGDELTATQLDSVVMFVALLRKDTESALMTARNAAKINKPSLKFGRAVFRGRCALCHGTEAKGNGRMAERLNPKPVNLTLSRAPDSYLKTIITLGGGEVGRSPRMPTWGDHLTDAEIDSLILHINTLRPAVPKTSIPLSRKASAKTGAAVFKDYCVPCHGETGQGDGPIASTVASKPANLTKSRLPNDYMRTIITEGSAAIGRSANMPPWGGALSDIEIDSVILHINTLRPSFKQTSNH